MARITHEDCRHAVPNRFELVLLAAERARALGRGEPSLVESNRDTSTVIALREIASGRLDPDRLRMDIVLRRLRATHTGDAGVPDDAFGDAFGESAEVVVPDEGPDSVDVDDGCWSVEDKEAVR